MLMSVCWAWAEKGNAERMLFDENLTLHSGWYQRQAGRQEGGISKVYILHELRADRGKQGQC